MLEQPRAKAPNLPHTALPEPPRPAQCGRLRPLRHSVAADAAMQARVAQILARTAPSDHQAAARHLWRLLRQASLACRAAAGPIRMRLRWPYGSRNQTVAVRCCPASGTQHRSWSCICSVELRPARRPDPSDEMSVVHKPATAAGTGEALAPAPAPIGDGLAWPIFALDDGGRLLGCNAVGQSLHGPDVQVVGLAATRLVHPDERTFAIDAWHKATATGRPIQLVLRLRHADGAYHPSLVHLDACRNDHGTLTGYVGLHLQLSGADAAGVTLRPTEPETLGNSFLTVASHELRTPLTSLQLTLQLALQRLKQQPEATVRGASLEGMVTRSLKQTHRLIEVVSDILDASRLHHNRLRLRPCEVDLNQLLLDTLAMFDRPFAEAGCRVTVHLTEGIFGQWDRGRIEQVFFDLLANVLKHAPGSHVTLSSHCSRGVAQVTVQDDGPGIPTGQHHAIFGRFGRAAESRGISGLGLGLYLCRQIVDEHGGSLQVSGDVGEGATFVARLPQRHPSCDTSAHSGS